MTTRPPGAQTRTISRNTAPGSGKWCTAKRVDDDRERAVRAGQARDVALTPGDVGDTLLGGEVARALQHRPRHVDAGRMPDERGKRADDDAAAAGDIEHRVIGPASAAATIICSAPASAIGAAVLNGIAWRVNWSRMRLWCAASVIR